MRATLIIKPLPRNVHPEYHQSRCVARTVTLHKDYGTLEDVRWVDAACGLDRSVAVAYHPSAPPLTHFLDTLCTPEEAEEAAIALAIAKTNVTYILSDSKTAILNFARGRVHPPGWQILRVCTVNSDRLIELVWEPAHSGNPANEAADNIA